jgi:hypothetical protein
MLRCLNGNDIGSLYSGGVMNYRKMECGMMVIAVGMEGSLADLTNKLENCQSCEISRCKHYKDLIAERDAEEKRIQIIRGNCGNN